MIGVKYMLNLFKKKQVVEKKPTELDWEQINDNWVLTEQSCTTLFTEIFQEPETNASVRLLQGAKDYGASRGIRAYNAHQARVKSWQSQAVASATKNYRTANQWINVPQSVNAGFSNAQLSFYLFQSVNYYDCMIQAQDPLMNKVLNILSQTPFSKGGEITNLDKAEADEVLQTAQKKKIGQKMIKALRSTYSMGGCLLYMQTEDEDLTEPLDLTRYDVRRITDFIHIDPINIVAVEVNTSEPAKSDYMQPSMWYIVGLGNVHASRFLKFEDNVPELLLKPLCLYFGTPLTNLIKQDIANSNLASQGLANLINRCRYLFLKTDDNSYTTGNIRNFNNRLKSMSLSQDNFMFTPIKTTEDVLQQTTALTGFAETTEFLYELISAKTSIPMTELMGTSAKGMNATGEGDRRSWYDRVSAIRELVKPNLEKILGIIAGQKDGIFKEIEYRFNLLESPTEREAAEINKATLEVAKAIIEVGGSQEQVFDWLKKNDLLGIDSIDFDQEHYEDNPFGEDITLGDDQDAKQDVFNACNAAVDNDKWITVKPHGEEEKGKRLLLQGDETPKEAMKRQWGIDLDKKKQSEKEEKKATRITKEEKEDFDILEYVQDKNHSNIDKIGKDLQNEIAKALKDSDLEVQNINVARGGSKFIKDADALASSNFLTGSIYLNQKFFKDKKTFEKMRQIGEKAKQFVFDNYEKLNDEQKKLVDKYKMSGRQIVDDSVQGVINHEIGHLFRGKIQDAEVKMLVERMGKYAPKISGYANSNFNEYLAESYAAYKKGEQDIIDEEMIKIFKKYGAKNG